MREEWRGDAGGVARCGRSGAGGVVREEWRGDAGGEHGNGVRRRGDAGGVARCGRSGAARWYPVEEEVEQRGVGDGVTAGGGGRPAAGSGGRRREFSAA